MRIYRIILATLLAALLATSAPAAEKGPELLTSPEGYLDGRLASMEVFKRLRAFCSDEGGKPLAVISMQAGGFVRLIEVSPDEAARHIASSGDGKYPWYFACEGDARFIVEKDYRYSPGEPNKFRLSRGRGLEWLDYIKYEEREKIAGLEAMSAGAEKAGVPEDERFLEEMALQASSLQMDFVRAGKGARYEAKYNNGKKAEGCSRVTIKYAGYGQSGEKSFDYKVCGSEVALLKDGDPINQRGPVALLAGGHKQ